MTRKAFTCKGVNFVLLKQLLAEYKTFYQSWALTLFCAFALASAKLNKKRGSAKKKKHEKKQKPWARKKKSLNSRFFVWGGGRLYVGMYVLLNVCMFLRMYICMWGYKYVGMYVCMWGCMYIGNPNSWWFLFPYWSHSLQKLQPSC